MSPTKLCFERQANSRAKQFLSKCPNTVMVRVEKNDQGNCAAYLYIDLARNAGDVVLVPVN